MAKIIQSSTELRQRLTKQEVLFKHEMHKSELFNDENLGELIDAARQAGSGFYTLGALDDDGFGEKWQTGVLGDMSGKDILQSIKTGRLWLQVQRLQEISPKHFKLAKQSFEELKQDIPGFDYQRLTSNVLISSPQAQVLCHIDCAEVVLFHIRGRKRFFLYDIEKHDFASDETIETVVLRESEEEIPYAKEWDKLAATFDLEPGDAANFPHFWPHKVVNLSDLNVSLQTEFYTPNGVRRIGVRFANGVLRRRFGFNPSSSDISGPLGLGKAGLGLVAKKLGLNRPTERKIKSVFTIDPERSGCIRTLAQDMQVALNK